MIGYDRAVDTAEKLRSDSKSDSKKRKGELAEKLTPRCYWLPKPDDSGHWIELLEI